MVTPATNGQGGHSKPLSTAALSVWAKTGKPGQWLPLAQHLADSRAMAGRLFDEWLCRSTRKRWLDALGPAAKVIAEFIAGTHDIGKAAPAFVAQSEPLAQIAREAGLPCKEMLHLKEDRKHLPHTVIGESAMLSWLKEHGVKDSKIANQLPSVVGAHHGKPTTSAKLNEPKSRPDGMGGSAWREVRTELLDWMAALTGFDRILREGLPSIPLHILVELSGLVVVADWLASNTALFPLQLINEPPNLLDPDRAAHAWDEIGMPPPWEPNLDTTDAETFFPTRFGWPQGIRPHPVQQAALAAARQHDIGLMFVETTTGGGKTEAALAAAEALAARTGAQGLLIALPTQATTNAMFDRMAAWIDRLPQPPVDVGAWALTLAHGKARLNPKFAELVEQFREFEQLTPEQQQLSAMYDEQDDDPSPCNAVVHSWFAGAKRRLLANFAVVTIDQLLMAALQRKHLMLAHIALSGKIVIIDEAHASDDYMNVYLDSALSWLGGYGVPVIVLSATLTEQRRKAMMIAYSQERRAEVEALTFDPADYPLLTVLPRDETPIVSTVVADNAQRKTVHWSWHSTQIDDLVATVAAELNGRGCALVVRNTVRDAQETAQALVDAGLPVMLNHAGFISQDRANNDLELKQLFGTGEGERPELMVVVATQVVEQSLDVDFDILFTDLAPMDLLLQRIGRLHRHPNWRPEQLRKPRVAILADEAPGEPPAATPGSCHVYGQHHLLRTAAALISHGPAIRLPEDVSPLVAAALGDAEIAPEAWQAHMAAARKQHEEKISCQKSKASTWCVKPWEGQRDKRTQLRQWLITRTTKTNSSSAPDYSEIQMGATVRDTEPSLEVIIIALTPDGQAAITPPWLQKLSEETEILDTSTQPSDELARRIASWSIRLPAALTRWRLDAVIEAIDGNPITKRWAWRRHPLLKGELLLPMTQLEEGGTALRTTLDVGGQLYELRYSPQHGLEVTQQ